VCINKIQQLIISGLGCEFLLYV